jgi:hypothetical protein
MSPRGGACLLIDSDVLPGGYFTRFHYNRNQRSTRVGRNPNP